MKKAKNNITLRLVLSFLALSIIGIVIIFSIVNTTIRDIIYDNVVSITERENIIRTQEIDSWFSDAAERVLAIAAVLEVLPSDDELYREICEHFVESNPGVIENLFIAFDFRILNGLGFFSGPDWDSRTRPWYAPAVEAGVGNVGFTPPYHSIASGNISIAVSTHMPELAGEGAVVGTAIPINFVLEHLAEHAGSPTYERLILVDANNNIIVHPDEAYRPYVAEVEGEELLVMTNIRNIPNGDIFLRGIQTDEVIEFQDTEFGEAYLFATQIDTSNWSLLAVIPETAVMGPVLQYTTVIMFALSLLVLLLFAAASGATLYLVRNLKESKNVEEQLETIVNNMPIAAHIADEDKNLLMCNDETARLFKLNNTGEFLERLPKLSPVEQPDGSNSAEKSARILGKLYAGERQHFMWMHQTTDGEPLPCKVTLIPVDVSERRFLLCFIEDLRDFYRYQESERIAKQRLHAILDSSPLACLLCDENMKVLEANQEILKLFELNSMDAFIQNFFNLSPKYQPSGRLSGEVMVKMRDKVLQEGRVSYEWMCRTLTDKEILCECTLVKVIIDDKPLIIGYMRDLREVIDAFSRAKQFENLAYTDIFTGAGSRLYFTETAERALRACIKGKRGFSLIMLDIDRFKVVNDTYGNSTGDEVLKVMVNRVQSVLDESVLLARYSGVEFVIMLPTRTTAEAVELAKKIQSSVSSSPFIVNGIKLDITISFGIACAGPGAEELDIIIDNSNKALRAAKKKGVNSVAVYGEE